METKSIYLSYSLLLVFLILLNISCQEEKIWDLPVAEIRGRCRSSQYSFLKSIDFTRKKLSDVKKLGPGACYYFYYIFKALGDNAQAMQVLTIGAQEEKGVWQELCHLLLVEHLLADKQYPEAREAASGFLETFKQSENSGKVVKYSIESLYWQQQDAETLDAIDKVQTQEQGISSDPELLLFKAVALYRTGKPGWKELFVKLFLENRSSLLHSRAYRFLEIQEVLEQFSGTEKKLLQAKYLLNTGKTEEALPLLKAVVESFMPGLPDNSTLLYELGTAFLNAGKYSEGAAWFSGSLKQFSGDNLLTAREMIGRLYRKTTNRSRGLEPLKAVFTTTSDPEQKERTLWYYLEIVYNTLPDQFIKEVMTRAGDWQDAEYYADLLNEEISSLAGQKKWDTLWKLYTFLKSIGPESIVLRLSYILSRALSYGFFSLPAEAGSVYPAQFLEPVLYMKGIDYHCFLAGYVSGKTPLLFAGKAEKTQASHSNARQLNMPENLILGFYEYGLSGQGIKLAAEHFEELGRETLVKTIQEMYAQQQYKQGISFSMKYIYNTALPFEPVDLEYLFPVFYDTFVEARAKKEGFAPYLLFSLIYKESAFDSSVVSSANAAGLTQLLPDTAADMANLLKIKNPDLKDPETNITLGAKYLGRLFNAMESIPKAFMAYNAGSTRVRRWEKDYADLPPDLFIEAIPYEETRLFIQRIMETAVMYGYLYYNKDYKEVIKAFFPDLAVAGAGTERE